MATTAIVTGASRGFGRALAAALAERGWRLVLDARGRSDLDAVREDLAARTDVAAVAGDVADGGHRRRLVSAARRMGGLHLLVNNAGVLGPSPRPPLARYPLRSLEQVLRVNLTAPIALAQAALPLLRTSGGGILNVTSDAAVQAYPGWGGYGAAKAALEQASAVLAVEEPAVRVWWVDPGDMRTRMHEEAFPGEDISDRPLPEQVVPAILRLLDAGLPSGRYLASELLAGAGAAR